MSPGCTRPPTRSSTRSSPPPPAGSRASAASPRSASGPRAPCRWRCPKGRGKVEWYSALLAEAGADPLPGRFVPGDDGGAAPGDPAWSEAEALELLTGASHHFVSSSLANQRGLLDRAGPPFVEVHP